MEKIIIQKEITITRKEINKIIKQYEKVSDSFGMGFGCKIFDKKGIIKEIKNLTYIGKQILLMKKRYEDYKKNEKRNYT